MCSVIYSTLELFNRTYLVIRPCPRSDIMAARTSLLFARAVRATLPAFHHKPVVSTAARRRGVASHRNATYPRVPYEKGERVGVERSGPFDLGMKVFVVTGIPPRPARFSGQFDFCD